MRQLTFFCLKIETSCVVFRTWGHFCRLHQAILEQGGRDRQKLRVATSLQPPLASILHSPLSLSRTRLGSSARPNHLISASLSTPTHIITIITLQHYSPRSSSTHPAAVSASIEPFTVPETTHVLSSMIGGPSTAKARVS